MICLGRRQPSHPLTAFQSGCGQEVGDRFMEKLQKMSKDLSRCVMYRLVEKTKWVWVCGGGGEKSKQRWTWKEHLEKQDGDATVDGSSDE